jgi:hypothetical protein
MADYFNENLTYDSINFRRRFQMDQTLFLRILDDLTNLYPYFVQKPVHYFFPTVVSSQAHFQADVSLIELHGQVGTESSPEAYCRHPTASLWYAPGRNRRVLSPWQNNSTAKPSYLLLRNSRNLWSNVSSSSKQRRSENNTCGEHQTRLPGMHQ